MGSFSLMHWIVVLAIILILFGAGKLPRVMGDFAKGIKAFKAGMKEEEESEATASGSSSSFMPALKALMPLAKSPITRGSFPAPNRMRIMARTTIQCIKLKEPIATTPNGG